MKRGCWMLALIGLLVSMAWGGTLTPQPRIVEPVRGAQVTGTVPVVFTAQDDKNLTMVVLYVNGQRLIFEQGNLGRSFHQIVTWDTLTVPEGLAYLIGYAVDEDHYFRTVATPVFVKRAAPVSRSALTDLLPEIKVGIRLVGTIKMTVMVAGLAKTQVVEVDYWIDEPDELPEAEPVFIYDLTRESLFPPGFGIGGGRSKVKIFANFTGQVEIYPL